MDRRTLLRWQDAAVLIDRYAVGHASGHRPALVRVRAEQLAKRSPTLFDGPWTPEASRHAMRSRRAAPDLGDDLVWFGEDDGHGVDLVRSLRLGHAVAHDDVEAVPQTDAAFVADALSDGMGDFGAAFASALRLHATARPPDDVTSGSLTSALPFLRRGARGRTVLSGTAACALTETDPADAPVVARLRLDDGTWFDLREHGDALLRPLLAPDGSGPVTVGHAARLAREGRAWPDSPFSPQRRVRTAAVDLDCYAVPAPDGTEGLAEAAARALGLAGRLHVVRGVLHRETGAPVLHLDHREGGHDDPGCGTLRVGWALPCGLRRHVPVTTAPTRDGDDSKLAIFRDATGAPVLRPELSFPIGAHARVDLFAESLRAASLRGDLAGTMVLGADREPSFTIVEPSRFPDDPHCLTRAVEGLDELTATVSRRAEDGGRAALAAAKADMDLVLPVLASLRTAVEADHGLDADEGVAHFTP